MIQKYHDGQIVAVDDNGNIDESIKVYDFSLTRNVVQMIIALALLVWIMLTIAKKYKRDRVLLLHQRGHKVYLSPLLFLLIDEVAKPNLGNKYQKYLPYLLTVFFFILLILLLG